MHFDPIDFIVTKKSGRKHKPGEIANFIEEIVIGGVSDIQVAAWLMAVCFNGLNFRETLDLTHAMTNSGKVYTWDDGGPPVVDKHSTGGVGDTVTLIVAPLAAAMGMRMGKHSGRGLGHTGGTTDKLESIPGFRTSLDEKEFMKIVNTAGCALAGQDESMTPADGILYSIRDVTATVDQEALIASSIMSKKLASGAGNILLDIKVGSGAFMKDRKSAMSLAGLMTKLGRESGRNVKTLLSTMDVPLGRSVGNSLEVIEAIRIMKGAGQTDDPLRLISIEIAARLATMCGQGNIQKSRSRADRLIKNGAALERFGQMIEFQGGDMRVIDNPIKVLPAAGRVLKIKSPKSGFVRHCDALEIGELVRDLGGGRKSKKDEIDPSVGLVLHKRPGDEVARDDILCEIHTNGALTKSETLNRALSAFRITVKKAEGKKLFLN